MTIEFEIVNKTICLCARRNSGKSQLLRYIIIKNKKKFNAMFLICPTEKINKFYDNKPTADTNKVSELISELYLCENPNNKKVLWGQINDLLIPLLTERKDLKKKAELAIKSQNLEDIALIIGEIF
jgi:hypothetical protein